LPLKPADVLAHAQRVINFTFIVEPERLENLAENDTPKGSNGWAIAPSRSQSGNAMLLANPHLPWSDLYLWYEAQLIAPEINAYGATLVGFPVLTIAFNDNLGWTHTVNTHDGWDAYELPLANDGYRFNGKIRSFDREEKVLKVKEKNGNLRSESLVVRRSVRGPILAEKQGSAIALRVVGLDKPAALQQWWDMARSKNFSEFETALKRLEIPMFTVMYADRVVGAPIANRNRAEIQGLIVFFVNTLVLRTDLSDTPTFRELLARIREVTLEAYAHQELPLEKLMEELQPQRDLSYNPLFQVSFVLQNAPLPIQHLPGMALTVFEVKNQIFKFDLTVNLEENLDEISANFEYSTDLFDAATICRMAGPFQTLLKEIAANPDRCIEELALLTENERYQLLREWNDAPVDYPRDRCIYQLFEQQEERTPDAVAVVFEDQKLTCRKLSFCTKKHRTLKESSGIFRLSNSQLRGAVFSQRRLSPARLVASCKSCTQWGFYFYRRCPQSSAVKSVSPLGTIAPSQRRFASRSSVAAPAKAHRSRARINS
jgi:Penicillin amidase/Condensation domain